MYRSLSEFSSDFGKVRGYYDTFSKNIPWMAPPDERRGWDIYQQALNTAYGILVMGRTVVDEAGRTPSQFGNAITLEDHRGLGIITHSDEAPMIMAGKGAKGVSKTTGGMIMHFYADLTSEAAWRGKHSGYHFLYNDAWLLGGAHGRHDFNMASPRRLDNIWDVNNKRLTATGRELVFLATHGYKPVKVGRGPCTMGLEVMNCADDKAASGATLASLVSVIQRIKEQKHINRLVSR